MTRNRVMPHTYTYRVYYERDRSKAEIMISVKNDEQIRDALRSFSSDVLHRLDDPHAEVSKPNVELGDREMTLTVRTSASLEAVNAAMEASLPHWGLFAEAPSE